MLTVRTATERDLDAIILVNEAGRPHVASLDHRELQRLHSLGAQLFVAESSRASVRGYLIAFSHLHDYDAEEFQALRRRIDCSFLYIDQVAVHPDVRRAGGGLLLYEAAHRFARIHNLEKLCCEVNLEPPNPRSLAFHEKAGFSPLGTLDVTDGRTVVLLARDVRP
ncbi:GNAT family N-acetyltransferase [Peristeroidobacter agariperforans]|uniref:GNAT family N-acetyltransferase n=1 Tax=Peristeroidobacter agariperforans TaxID=268404 RepID=UPI00101D2A51|nr:GNAT family N-acetyltransferase [Peristeroidobacter agariperforans]